MPPRTKAPGNTLAPSSSSRPAAAPRPPRSNLKPEDISDLRTKALCLLYPNPVLRHLDIDPKTVSRARKLVQQILDEAATLDPEVGYPDDYLSEDADEFCDEYGSEDSYNDEYRREERGMERLEKRDKATELASLQAFAHHFLAELSPAAPPLAAVANADMSKRHRVDAVGGDGKSKELTRAEHFEEARWAVQRFTLNVSRTGSVWGPENQLAHAQYWLTVARCADELAPERVEPGYHGHATDWRAAFWKEPPGAAGQRLKGYCAQPRPRRRAESTLAELDTANRCLVKTLDWYAAKGSEAPGVQQLCLEALLADVRAHKAALLARALKAKYSPAPFLLDEDDVHAAKQANKQAAAAFRAALETLSKLGAAYKAYKKSIVEIVLLRKLEQVNLAALDLLNPDQAARIETAQGELAETRKTLAAREKETAGAAAT